MLRSKATWIVMGTVCALQLAPARADAVKPNDASIRPFEIHVPESVLQDLNERLARTRFPDQLPGAGWGYGTDLAYMTGLVNYWRAEYDWRQAERNLNKFHQFKTSIDGLDIHFIHERSRHENALPLVLIHGWPGSFYEFHKIIGPLTDPEAYGGRAEDAFHVVVPSLPGFGFSDKPAEKGWSNDRMAQAIARLMERLGYDRYGAQGGDWGASISTWLGRNDAEHCIGIHLNFVTAGPPRNVPNPMASLAPDEAKRLRERQQWAAEEFAYNQIQGTRPQTLGYGLNDSPAGLAAWIVEKFQAWSDCNGDVEKRFTKDELLTNVMIYWVTQSITSSTRIYYESRHSPGPGKQGRVEIPVGCAVFPREIVYAPRQWVEQLLNVTRWTEMPAGGHFPAMEEPDLLVKDIHEFFQTVR